MRTSAGGVVFIRAFEGLRLKAYRDQAGIPTIGYGTIQYRDGRKVRMTDKITEAQAEELLSWQISLKEFSVNRLLHPYKVSQNQFDALMSFTYNVGIGGLETSTLLKKVRKDPADPSIAAEFLRWNKVKNGKDAAGKWKYKVSKGLAERRKREAELYFTP